MNPSYCGTGIKQIMLTYIMYNKNKNILQLFSMIN